MTITENIIEAVKMTSVLEWAGVLTSIAYVVLASFRRIECWIFGFISSSIYVYICYEAHLFLETYLQVFYIGMAIYGWINWKKNKLKTVPVIFWKLKFHLSLILVGSVATIGLGYYFGTRTTQASPYLDAAITAFSLLATWMTARRVIEGWVYWVIIDGSAIYLYTTRDLYMTSVLFFIFTVMSLSAFFQWYKQFQSQRSLPLGDEQLIDAQR